MSFTAMEANRETEAPKAEGESRNEEMEADVAFLEKAVEEAPVGDPSDEEMEEIYAGIRERRLKGEESRVGQPPG